MTDEANQNNQKTPNPKILCISASNRIRAVETNSYRKCKIILDEADKHISDMQGEIIEMQRHTLCPCNDCSKCLNSRRCSADDDFNIIYEKIIACDILFIVSPHYAPIPAKLIMLLEKWQYTITAHSSKDKSYKSETYGIPTAIITHGATAFDTESRKKKKLILNDPIVNGLHGTQIKIVPFDDEWNTGICVQPAEKNTDGETAFLIQEYVRRVLNAFGISSGA